MSYTPIGWQNGDTITAEKMNKMDNGWSVGTTQLLSETVTTVDSGGMITAILAYTGLIDADVITVTLNGVDYTCPKIPLGATDNAYGGYNEEPDYTSFPFFIESHDSIMGYETELYTQTAGTYTITVKTQAIEVSSDFASAVNLVAPLPMLCVSGVTTYDEMIAAKNAGRLMYFWTETEGYGCYIIRKVDFPCAINPTTTSVIANFDNNNVLVITEQ